MSMINREVAWRIFAEEFNRSTLETGGSEERSPSYVITPLGAKVNRVYVVGVLTETENIGTPAEPMWRARVTDPTGTYFISAGQYQPGVATALANMEPPTFVAVVGKANTYKPDEETTLVNLRGELIKEVSEEQRDYWILESTKSLKRRLEAVTEASQMEEVSVEELVELGYDADLADGIQLAMEHYGTPSLEKYWRMIEDSLRYILPEYERSESVSQEEDEKDEGIEEEVLKVIEELEDMAEHDNGVEYERVMNTVIDNEGIDQDRFEEAVNSLRSSGKVYEPVLGNLKIID